MKNPIQQMLEPYACNTITEYENALREIFQELILLGLWRAKFFEHAAFYGGTALRILYKLDRFSEDMDFSLLKPNQTFDFTSYAKKIEKELQAWGFTVKVETKIKTKTSTIESAFLKANTLKQMLVIELPQAIIEKMHNNRITKIKIDIDTHPPPEFSTESHYLLRPFPFAINTYSLPSLFAGKLHALLFRNWKNRVKGRDWYDYVWFLARDTPVDINHLQQRMVQTGDWKPEDTLTRKRVVAMLKQKAETLNIKAATQDVVRFIKNEDTITVWSNGFFSTITDRLKTI